MHFPLWRNPAADDIQQTLKTMLIKSKTIKLVFPAPDAPIIAVISPDLAIPFTFFSICLSITINRINNANQFKLTV